jgi:hypothetical protein
VVTIVTKLKDYFREKLQKMLTTFKKFPCFQQNFLPRIYEQSEFRKQPKIQRFYGIRNYSIRVRDFACTIDLLGKHKA